MLTVDCYALILRGKGRIVEALIEDFKALSGSGILTVSIQNTGFITADYSVCLKGNLSGFYYFFLYRYQLVNVLRVLFV